MLAGLLLDDAVQAQLLGEVACGKVVPTQVAQRRRLDLAAFARVLAASGYLSKRTESLTMSYVDITTVILGWSGI